MKPYKQNDFDGLCSLMSVINSITYLFPDKINEHTAVSEELIEHIVRKLGPIQFHEIWLEGTERADIKKFLNYSRSFLKKYDMIFTYKPISIKNMKSTEEFWEFLFNSYRLNEENKCIIVGFDLPVPHWTVFTSLLKDKLVHFDSAGYIKTNISDTQLLQRAPPDDRYWKFDYRDIFIIERTKNEESEANTNSS